MSEHDCEMGTFFFPLDEVHKPIKQQGLLEQE